VPPPIIKQTISIGDEKMTEENNEEWIEKIEIFVGRIW